MVADQKNKKNLHYLTENIILALIWLKELEIGQIIWEKNVGACENKCLQWFQALGEKAASLAE